MDHRVSGYFVKGAPDFTNTRGQTIDASGQIQALAQAQSIVYLSIFIVQCFNVFAVKAKFSFPFGRNIIGNTYNFLGILGGACLGMFIIYTPPLHVVFGGSYHLSPLYWLIPCAFGVLLLVWSSIRVLLLRKSIEQQKVKDIRGLMMCKWSPFFEAILSKEDCSPDYAYDEYAIPWAVILIVYNTHYDSYSYVVDLKRHNDVDI